jgi:hyperosmotically inducible periplasmic protein
MPLPRNPHSETGPAERRPPRQTGTDRAKEPFGHSSTGGNHFPAGAFFFAVRAAIAGTNIYVRKIFCETMKTINKLVSWASRMAVAGCAGAAAGASGRTLQGSAPAADAASRPGASKQAMRVANRLFARKVREALERKRGLEGADIAVFADARSGQVMLGGFIESQEQEGIATEAAGKVPGLKSVASKIVLRPQL